MLSGGGKHCPRLALPTRQPASPLRHAMPGSERSAHHLLQLRTLSPTKDLACHLNTINRAELEALLDRKVLVVYYIVSRTLQHASLLYWAGHGGRSGSRSRRAGLVGDGEGMRFIGR